MKNKPKKLRLEDYKLGPTIGEGSLAFVRQAATKGGKQLACKIIQKDTAIKSRQADRVINEATILSQLRSPFVV
jgi:protein kinase A